jgi:hypothetical protein
LSLGPTLIVDGNTVPILGVATLGIVVGYVAGMFGIGGGSSDSTWCCRGRMRWSR